MRKDFNKVLTERPRRGHKRKYKEIRKSYNSEFSVRAEDEEDGPLGGTEGMRQPYRRRFIDKNNSDLWGAIRRLMQSHVGRRWDDVWSELNRDLQESDDMRAHWRVHCKIEVDEKVSVAPNGKLWRLAGRGAWIFDSLDRWGWPVQGIPGCNKRFYVDPRDGILRKTPRYVWPPARSQKSDQTDHEWLMPDGVTIKYIGGIWYEVWSLESKYMESVPVYGPWDREFKREVIGHKLVERSLLTYRKRQLSSRELIQYGVRNA